MDEAEIILFIKSLYPNKVLINISDPKFQDSDTRLLNQCIKNGHVSTNGSMTTEFENRLCTYTGSKHAIATVNGSMAIYACLNALGANQEAEILVPSLTFISTVNPILLVSANPVFIDIELKRFGMCPQTLADWLKKNTIFKQGRLYNKRSRKRILACFPVHILGYPCLIQDILEVCNNYKIPVIEDAAQALGSFSGKKHAGTLSKMGILSFNGNKIISTGGGGAILTNNNQLAANIRLLINNSTKVGKWMSNYNQVGFNLKMPALNAAFGIPQLERIEDTLQEKAKLAQKYADFFADSDFKVHPMHIKDQINHWVNTIIAPNLSAKNRLLRLSSDQGVHLRCIWKPLHQIKHLKGFESTNMANTDLISKTLIQLPSSV